MDLSRREFTKAAVAGSVALGANAAISGGSSSVAGRVVVMHNGTICEHGSVTDVLQSPKDPYTAQLLADAPQMTMSAGAI